MKWKEWELVLLKNKYPSQKANIPELSHRTVGAIRVKACQLELTSQDRTGLIYKKQKGWANCYQECISCGRTSVPHAGKGLCKTCYNKTHGHSWSSYNHEIKATKYPSVYKMQVPRFFGSRHGYCENRAYHTQSYLPPT